VKTRAFMEWQCLFCYTKTSQNSNNQRERMWGNNCWVSRNLWVCSRRGWVLGKASGKNGHARPRLPIDPARSNSSIDLPIISLSLIFEPMPRNMLFVVSVASLERLAYTLWLICPTAQNSCKLLRNSVLSCIVHS